MKIIITIVMVVISIFGMGGFLQNHSERKAKIDLNEIYKKNEEGNLVQGKEKINEMNNGTYPQVSLKGNNYNYWKWLYIDSTNDRGLDEEYFPSGYGESRGKVEKEIWQTHTYEVKRIKVNDYSNGWDDFWKYYSNIYIDFKYSYNLWNGQDDWSYEGVNEELYKINKNDQFSNEIWWRIC